ncbi:MAG: 5-methyltetrahydropteroyltriglutamate--homocysteine S-methyltransferase, partial [Firmicutes bacterium]|nr:5-methyltetrahydropteroyltriglutamate--homocysteine S-methyltransferase [Bacillota bacterium]
NYGSRCVRPPILYGDVSRTKAMTVDWWAYAQSLTDKPMKGMLTGPVTILNWSFPREDLSLKEICFQIALAIRDEVLALEAAGIRIIQIDEAAFREKLPLRRTDWEKDYLDWAIPAFRLVHAGVKPETQIHTHMCYSDFSGIIKEIEALDVDVISFEAARSDLVVLDVLQSSGFTRGVGPGVYDVHAPRVPSAEELASIITAMVEKLGAERLWVNPDCGLKTRKEEETWASLTNMVRAARQVRDRLVGGS